MGTDLLARPDSDQDDDHDTSRSDKGALIDEGSEKSYDADKLSDLETAGKADTDDEAVDEEESNWINSVGDKPAGNGFSRKRLGLVGAGVAILVSGVGILGLLDNFKLDTIFQNVDSATMSRFNASFDRRSNAWTKAYIRLRLTEIKGDTSGDNLYFRANKVDTNHPVRDWYATLRAKKFEEKVFNKNGVSFTSMVNPETGKFQAAMIKIKDEEIPIDIINKYSNELNASGADINTANISDLINKIDTDDLDFFIERELFDSDKAGRKGVKKLVQENTRAWQVLKRRHIRKDIQNQTGIRSWRLFETTRTKIEDKKTKMQQKIINKVFSSSRTSSRIMRCLFGGAKCPVSTDPSDSNNRASANAESGDGATSEEDDGKEIIGEDDGADNRSPTDTADYGSVDGGELSATIEDAGSEAFEEIVGEAGEEATETISLTARQRFVKEIVDKIASGGPTSPAFWWGIAKKLASVDKLFDDSSGTSTVQKMVYSARMAQLAGVYATYAISKDQIRSGELNGEELGVFFETMKGFQNSEGWSRIASGNSFTKVSAAASKTIAKDEYCKDEHIPTYEEFAWYCDKYKPDGGGNATALTEAYNNSIGYLIGPIADGVNAIRSNPVFSSIDDLTSKAFDSLSGVLSGPTEAALESLGIKDSLNDLIGGLSERLLTFMGAAPIFTGSEPGVANFILAGGAATAEGSTRASGGVAQTPVTYDYSQKLAQGYQNEQYRNLSLYDKYLSPSNGQSMFAQAMLGTESMTKAVKYGNIVGGLFKNFSTLLTGSVFANDKDYSSTAAWAGVNRYDIPQECIDLDPLTVTQTNSTNYYQITGDSNALDWNTLRDTNKFYDKVYEWVNEDASKAKEAEKIFNCNLMDARVQGMLGYTSGYTKDNGYDEKGQDKKDNTATNPKIYLLGDSLTYGMINNGELKEKLTAKKWVPTLDGLGSRQIEGGPSPDGLTKLNEDEDAVKAAGTIVIALGTNYAGSDIKADLQKMYDAIKEKNKGAKIWWVNYVGTGSYADSMSARTIALTEWANEKKVDVIDWAKVGVETGKIPNNDVHPADYDAMAKYIVDQLGEPPIDAGDGTYKWPSGENAIITSCYGPRGGGMHAGIDISGAGENSPIYAAASGIVTYAGAVGGYGPNFVAIKHGDGNGTSYGHMNSMIVSVGDTVSQGQQIGTEGNLGNSFGSHLHFNLFPGEYSGSDAPNVDPVKNGLQLPSPASNPKGCGQ